jgi:hypothetical protein
MSKHETTLTRRFWHSIGGLSIEEFPAVKGSKNNGRRLIDAIIVPGEEKRIASHKEVSLKDKDIIVVQTKASRLGMYLMGQAVFSAKLMERFKPRSIRSVAICTKGDAVLEPLLAPYDVEVVVCEN